MSPINPFSIAPKVQKNSPIPGPTMGSQGKQGIADASSTISSSAPATNPVVQFTTAIKNQILTWIGTARAYILLKQLGGDEKELLERIKTADPILLRGIIKIFKEHWGDQLDNDKHDTFFLRLLQNQNYLEGYKLAYENGIPFTIMAKDDFHRIYTERETNALSVIMRPVINRTGSTDFRTRVTEVLREFSKIAPHLLFENYSNFSPYELAMNYDFKEAIELIQNLLKNGYLANEKEAKMILDYAVDKGHPEIIQTMFSRYPSMQQQFGYHLIELAFSSTIKIDKKRAEAMVNILLKAEISMTPEQKAKIFTSAVKFDFISTVQTMLEQDHSIINSEAVNAEHSILTQAILSGSNPQMVDILVRSGAKITADQVSGETALMKAFKLINNEKNADKRASLNAIISKLLGSASAEDLLVMDSNGRQALYYAIEAREADSATFMLDKIEEEGGSKKIVMTDSMEKCHLSDLAQQNQLNSVAERLSQLDTQKTLKTQAAVKAKKEAAQQSNETSSNTWTSWFGNFIPSLSPGNAAGNRSEVKDV